MAFESGSIAWSALQSTFGGANPIYLSEYYRGAGLVPNITANNGVPTSGTISAANFRGSTNYQNVGASKSGDAHGSTFQQEPAPANATVGSNAVTVTGSGGTGSYTYNWAFLSGSAGLTISGGTTGATKSWSGSVPKNSTRSAVWRCTVSDGTTSAVVDVSINLDYFTDL